LRGDASCICVTSGEDASRRGDGAGAGDVRICSTSGDAVTTRIMSGDAASGGAAGGGGATGDSDTRFTSGDAAGAVSGRRYPIGTIPCFPDSAVISGLSPLLKRRPLTSLRLWRIRVETRRARNARWRPRAALNRAF
jgi:hypothetical protein